MQKRVHEWGQLLRGLGGGRLSAFFFSIWILALRVAATFSVMLVILWRIVSLIFFIVSCRSISYTAVPFNLYSLGYFLKRFIEHYPRLDCIYYPLTQLLKWSISIWLWSSFLLLFAFPLISHRSLLHPGVFPFPNRSAWAEQPFKGKSLDLKKKIPALFRTQFAPTILSYKILSSACSVIRLGEDLSVPFVLLTEFARRKFLIFDGASRLWILSVSTNKLLVVWTNGSFNSSGLLSALLGQDSKCPAGSQAVVLHVLMCL